MKAHFVTFYNPGMLVSEDTTRPITAWDVDTALAMVPDIVEHHGATPYGFEFSTRERGPDDLDSKVTATSMTYWLGGKIETLAEVEARNDPKEAILRANMRDNGWDRIITNTNSWSITLPFCAEDVLLPFEVERKS